MIETPQREHEWLQKLTGEWTFEGQADMGPDKPPAKSRGTERVRSLGGLWIVAEGEGEMPGGGPANTMMSLGYDPRKQRFVGTWIGSMMSNLWVYEGTLDGEGKVLTLETEGPAMSGEGKMGRYRDIIEFDGGGRRVLRSAALGDDGTWREFMRAEYRRAG